MKRPTGVIPWTHAIEVKHKHVPARLHGTRLLARAVNALRVVALLRWTSHPRPLLAQQHLPQLLAAAYEEEARHQYDPFQVDKSWRVHRAVGRMLSVWSAPEARILGRRIREAQAGSDLLDGLLRPL